MTLSQRHDDGFTLVELLVSLALLSLMTIYALNAFSSLRDINRVADRIGSQMEVEAVARHFRETIADVRPIFVMDENNAPQFLFKGSKDSLEFVSASNGDRETGGLYLVRYSVDAEGTLLAERRLLRNGPIDEANKVILLRGVKDISFRYWASGTLDAGGVMLHTPQLNDLLPITIEVNLNFNAEDLRNWPSTFVNLETSR
jgi:prepilin-type N-terminal cleavage/methylation domain-containing protein